MATWVSRLVGALVAVSLVSSCVATAPETPQPPVASSPPAPTPTAPSPSTSPSPSESVNIKDYGDFPPTYLDEMKDVYQFEFPAKVLDFALEYTSDDFLSALADYGGESLAAAVTVTVYKADTHRYATSIDGLKDPEYIGRPVCGYVLESPTVINCVMAGKLQTLVISTASEHLTPADVAAFAEALYDAF